MMKTAVYLATLFICCAMIAQPVLAEGNLENGKVLAYTCFGCHGIEGYRNAYPSYRVPKLGGQKAAYLVAALKGYRNGTREHSTMHAQAQSLSEQEIEDVAAYIATRGTDNVAAGGTAGATFDKAGTCAACHGANGISMAPMWPTLAGQHEQYLVHALNSYRDGTRKDPVMSQMASALTDQDVLDIAHYFSSLKGLETTPLEKD